MSTNHTPVDHPAADRAWETPFAENSDERIGAVATLSKTDFPGGMLEAGRPMFRHAQIPLGEFLRKH